MGGKGEDVVYHAHSSSNGFPTHGRQTKKALNRI